MQKKLFKPIRATSAAAIISLASLASYIIGLYRDRIIAVNFGTTTATDTYNASFLIPDILFNLFIAGALAAAFMPVFTEYLIKDKKEANKIANTMLNGGTILIAIISAIAFIFMDSIIPIAFSEASIEAQKDIIQMTRLMLPSAILFAISNTLGNILMSYKHFTAYALSPVVYNLGIILGVIFLHESMGIYSAAIGVLIGCILHALVRVADAITSPYSYKPQLDFRHPAFKKILKLMIPRSISLIAWQINLYLFAKMGMRIMEGGFAAFSFARNIQSFAVSLFGIAFATAIFPFLSRAYSKGEKDKYTQRIQTTIQKILFFTIPAAIGLMLLAIPIVNLILGGGIFGEDSAAMTSIILYFFALSIPFESLVHILSRAYYARQNTITPMIINVLAMIIIGIITVKIAPTYGIEWFSIGFTIALVTQVTLLIIFQTKHLKGFKIKEFSTSLFKTIIATGIMAAVVFHSESLNEIINEKMASVIRICLGGGTFFLMAYILKSPELSSIHEVIKRIKGTSKG